MTLEWIYSLENIDWEEVYQLYLAAPLGHEKPSDLKVAFSNSMFKCFVYDAGRLIAVGRAVADGRDCSYISGVAVHPDHQGLGIGKEVVSKLVNLSKDHKKIIYMLLLGKSRFIENLASNVWQPQWQYLRTRLRLLRMDCSLMNHDLAEIAALGRKTVHGAGGQGGNDVRVADDEGEVGVMLL